MRRGFTLTEILVLLGLFAAFACLAFVIFNPTEEFSRARNIHRWSDLNKISQAISTYDSLNDGKILSSLPNMPEEICVSGDCDKLFDLSILVKNKYMDEIPKDPLCASECKTLGSGYFISKDKIGHIVLRAGLAELKESIAVLR